MVTCTMSRNGKIKKLSELKITKPIPIMVNLTPTLYVEFVKLAENHGLSVEDYTAKYFEPYLYCMALASKIIN